MIRSPWTRENVLVVLRRDGWYELFDTSDTADEYPVAKATGVSFATLQAALDFIERLPRRAP